MEKRRKLMAAWAEYCERAIDTPALSSRYVHHYRIEYFFENFS